RTGGGSLESARRSLMTKLASLFPIRSRAFLEASFHVERAANDAVVRRVATRDPVTRLSSVEAEIDGVVAGREVGVELKRELSDDRVPGLPEVHGVLAVEHRVISVVAALLAVDVNEGFPGAGDRLEHAIIETKLVGVLRDDGLDQVAGLLAHLPAHDLELVLEHGIDAVRGSLGGVEDH